MQPLVLPTDKRDFAMKPKLLLGMLSLMVPLIGCAPVVSERPCPRVTEFPRELQLTASEEIQGKPAITHMMNSMASDRAFNRAICS